MAVDFGNVKADAGLAKLDQHMFEHSFVEMHQPTAADAAVFTKLVGMPNTSKFPHAARWYKTMTSYTECERKAFPEVAALLEEKDTSVVTPATATPATISAKKADDDEVDLFGDDDVEDDLAAQMAKKAAEKKEAAAAKKEKKPVIGKSTVTLEVRGTSSEVDLDDLARQIQAIEIEGLQWVKSHEIKALFFGLNALIMGCIIIDDLVPLENINRAIMTVGLSEQMAKERNDAIDQGIDFDEEDDCLVKSVSVLSFVKL